MEMTGAKILMECLLEQGVDLVFGYPGGTILNVYDELYRYRDRITHILTAHEQGASHAADGYARSTGRVGVCLATSGPGATNLTTGIATAYMDSSPVVFITCNVTQNLIGRDAFQEVDITGIAMPITKCTYLVRDVNTLADTVREAFAIARSGRPGPVLIDIVKNVTAEKADYEYLPREKHITSGRLANLVRRARTSSLKMPEPNQEDVNKLVDMIAVSKKPMLICGGGVVRSRSHEEFREFARRLDAPVAITLMGGGGISGRDPLATGMIGMHGSKASNMACDGCDLLIAVGCRFSDRVALKPATFARQAKIVQIDIDRAEINKNVETDHHIIGNARQVLELLNRKLIEMGALCEDAISASMHTLKNETDKQSAEKAAALEREIEKQEQLSAQLDTQIEAAASDYQELARLMAEKQTCDDALTGLMDEWERLSSDLEGAT